MTFPLISLVSSFDWSRLTRYFLFSYVPFQIIVQAYHMVVPNIVTNEGTYVSILSSNAWQVLGSPHLVPITQNMLGFNKGTNQLLGILPKFLITLGGKTVYIDVMVVQGPLDFNLLLGCDYVYVMEALVSSLFPVICFSHEGNVVIIDQLTFICPESTPIQPSSLNGSYLQPVSTLPQVNYVATCSMPKSTDDLVGDVVHHVLGALEPNFSIGSLDMYPFQSVFLPSDEKPLESMATVGV